MKIEFPNGASVHRIYLTGTGELLAAFQYDGDAKEYANTRLAADAANKWFDASYAVFNSYDAKLTIFQHVKPETSNG